MSVCVCERVCVCGNVSANVFMYVCTYVFVYVCARVCEFARALICTYIHVSCLFMYICNLVYMSKLVWIKINAFLRG